MDNPIYREVLTTAHAAIVLCQLAISFRVRGDRRSALWLGLLSNPLLAGAGVVALAIIGSISYVPFLRAVFHTAPLSIVDWVLTAACGALVVIADEIRKFLLRRKA